MNKSSFMNKSEVADRLGVSESKAYKVISALNDELKAQGYLTLAGRINRDYFEDRCYKSSRKEEKGSDQIASI